MDIKTIVITGASGYLGSWITKTALDAGFIVRATVRDPDDSEKVGHLWALPGQDRLSLHRADLTAPGSFDEAVSGADAVIHSASPFQRTGIQDPQAELVTPAVEGTRTVLNAVDDSPSVRRVVLTSSVVAIMGDAAEARKYPRSVVDETRWNHTSSLHHEPYGFSKTQAERLAWERHAAQKRWDLITINPAFILGPALSERLDGASVSILRQLGDGSFERGAPDLAIGYVDVRDVATAHVRAVQRPEASGRYILSERVATFADVAAWVKERFGDGYRVPNGTVPKWFLWLIAPSVGLTRRYVRQNVGIQFSLDNRRSRSELGIEYRRAPETVCEHFQQLVDRGIIQPRA